MRKIDEQVNAQMAKMSCLMKFDEFETQSMNIFDKSHELLESTSELVMQDKLNTDRGVVETKA